MSFCLKMPANPSVKFALRAGTALKRSPFYVMPHANNRLLGGILIRQFALVASLAIVSGCSVNNWAVAPQNGDSAGLRVVSLAPGNSFVGVTKDGSCEEGDALMYGWFHPGASEAWQASRRGFDRRIGMPDGNHYSAHLFAEHRVAVGTEMTFLASSTSAQSPNPYDVGVCRVFKKAKLSVGRDYELVLGRQSGSCSLEMFELVRKSDGGIVRAPLPLISACGQQR